MGSSPSKGGGGRLFRHQDARGQGADVKLPGSRLRFSKEQVQRLNLLLTRLEQHANHGEFTFHETFPCARDGARLQSCKSAGRSWTILHSFE
jgi:hypothetical protein